ncbi:hypothetical protein [Leifsonia xyli]|uniref:hypothetical protein n=1 Tax=Leifsonia xyli TaxID=1575 RepID=UPI003D66428B
MAQDATNPIWVVILVGALSGVIGAIAGPIIQRVFGRNDRALDARQSWAREKLQRVFGLGDEWVPTDGAAEPFGRLVPPSGYKPQRYDMHTINWAVLESVDLMMLQPRRSKWARQWLYNWHFVLQREYRALHTWMHDLRERGVWDDKHWDRANEKYERRVRRVESSLSIWATGQWLTHPSPRIWVSGRDGLHELRQKRVMSQLHRKMPEDIRRGEYRKCDCPEWDVLNARIAEFAKQHPYPSAAPSEGQAPSV